MDEDRADSAVMSNGANALASSGEASASEETTRVTFPVERSHILMFARAIGDESPVYVDPGQAQATHAEGIIAPPTFLQAAAHFDPDWPLRPRPGSAWIGSGRTPTGMSELTPSSGRLHAEQHFEYFGVIRPGDVLTAVTRPGASWSKQSRRAGVLQFTETITEFRNQAGELVCISRRVVMTPERPVSSR